MYLWIGWWNGELCVDPGVYITYTESNIVTFLFLISVRVFCIVCQSNKKKFRISTGPGESRFDVLLLFRCQKKCILSEQIESFFFIYVYLYGYCCCLHSFSCVWVISNAYCSHTHFYRALFFYFFFFFIIAFSIQFLLSLPWRLVLTYTCTYSHMTRSVFIFISFHL